MFGNWCAKITPSVRPKVALRPLTCEPPQHGYSSTSLVVIHRTFSRLLTRTTCYLLLYEVTHYLLLVTLHLPRPMRLAAQLCSHVRLSRESEARAALLRPAELDMRLPDQQLHSACRRALLHNLTPVLTVKNHGLEPLCARVAEREASRRSVSRDSACSQLSFELGEDEHAQALRSALHELSARLLRILTGDPNADSRRLKGRLSLRVYPSSPAAPQSLRLGAHCDATAFTLLWSSAPGLQVLEPSRATEWNPKDVIEFGLPSLGPAPPELREEQWATGLLPQGIALCMVSSEQILVPAVDLPWAEGALLLSLGTAWASSEILQAGLPAKSAALHRVACSDLLSDRLSLPFLVDFNDENLVAC